MSGRNLVICDADEGYAARLAVFFNGKRELAFQVKICGNPEELQEIMADSAESILLLHESFLTNTSVKEWMGEILILSEVKRTGCYGKLQSVFKYQSSNELMRQILEKCERKNMEGVWRVRKSTQSKVIGLYTPVRRLGQTTFALEKAKELSKEANVLYLNLETYAGRGGYFPESKDKTLSTLLYYAKQEAGNIGMILATLVCSRNGVDYIPPVMLCEDLRIVTPEEWLWLFQELLRGSIYDVLILDLSESVQGLYEVLKFCDVVYMLIADDQIAASKIRQYEEDLRKMGYADVAERMIRCDNRGTITGKNSG